MSILKYNTTLNKAPWLLYLPPGLTIKNSTFLPKSILSYFLWFSQKAAEFCLHNINWLDFVPNNENIYCAVRTEFLYIIQVNIVFEHVI